MTTKWILSSFFLSLMMFAKGIVTNTKNFEASSFRQVILDANSDSNLSTFNIQGDEEYIIRCAHLPCFDVLIIIESQG